MLSHNGMNVLVVCSTLAALLLPSQSLYQINIRMCKKQHIIIGIRNGIWLKLKNVCTFVCQST